MQDMAIVTIEYYPVYQIVLYPMTLSDPSRPWHCSLSNNSKMVQDADP